MTWKFYHKVVVGQAVLLATPRHRPPAVAPGAKQLRASAQRLGDVLQGAVDLFKHLGRPQGAVDVHPVVLAVVDQPARPPLVPVSALTAKLAHSVVFC